MSESSFTHTFSPLSPCPRTHYLVPHSPLSTHLHPATLALPENLTMGGSLSIAPPSVFSLMPKWPSFETWRHTEVWNRLPAAMLFFLSLVSLVVLWEPISTSTPFAAQCMRRSPQAKPPPFHLLLSNVRMPRRAENDGAVEVAMLVESESRCWI
ncbi:hypothetical protein Hypma_012088 [Hypsizygus marmoreus]|uniref:Uncharacterized protein n=1 Tax=Hypsizygus marmoreus TaxID=39966 RepID=A0A369JM37_HYPMA|nr:hypothetical protein Hypma_012088 [Hypsizygus marmoreus]